MAVDAASLKTVAVQLRALAADRDNQPIIARDEGCMSALSNFLQSEDPGVSEIAVGALQHLSSHPDNKDIIRNDFGVSENVRTLIVNSSVDLAVRRDAARILRNVLDSNEDEEVEELKELERRGGLRVETIRVEADSSYALIADPITVRVHVPGLSDTDFLDDFEHRLIRARGILSLSYEMGAEVVVVFSRAAVEDVERVIKQISEKEVQVLPNETPEDEDDMDDEKDAEVDAKQAPADLSNGQAGEAENINKNADYIDEERKRYKKYAAKAKRTAVSRQGYSSLAQRLEAERKQAERERARSERMLGRIGRVSAVYERSLGKQMRKPHPECRVGCRLLSRRMISEHCTYSMVIS